MRTLNEITSIIKSDFVANQTLATTYGLDIAKSFDEQFSKLSLEACLIHVVAMSIWLLEQIIGTTKKEIDAQIERNYMCSVPWYHAKCMEYQDGYVPSYESTHYRYVYSASDANKCIVTFVAVREVVMDGVTTLRVLLSKEDKVPLTTDELARFSTYLHRIGAAGTHYDIVSKASDRLKINVQVNYNPLMLDGAGKKIVDKSEPVPAAVEAYINGIVYGGVFNKTRFIDAVQAAEGVVDVLFNEVQHATSEGEFTTLAGNSIESTSGSFTYELTISYLAQNEY